MKWIIFSCSPLFNFEQDIFISSNIGPIDFIIFSEAKDLDIISLLNLFSVSFNILFSLISFELFDILLLVLISHDDIWIDLSLSDVYLFISVFHWNYPFIIILKNLRMLFLFELINWN